MLLLPQQRTRDYSMSNERGIVIVYTGSPPFHSPASLQTWLSTPATRGRITVRLIPNLHWLPSSLGAVPIRHPDRVNDYTFVTINGNQYRKLYPTLIAGDDSEPSVGGSL